jgi:hypothetical protein
MAARGILEDIQAGQNYVSGLFDTQAKLRAGRAYAGGDYAGAAGLLASRGDLETAERVSQRGARTDVLSAVDKKDFGAARGVAAGAGNTALYGAAAGAEDDEAAQKTQWLTQATDALKQLPVEARQKAFTDYIAPTIKMMGGDDAMLSAIDATHLTDEALDAFKASLGGKSGKRIEKIGDSLVEIGSDGSAHEIYKAPAGSKVVGNSLVTDDGRVLYTAPEIRSVSEGQSLVEIGGDATAPAAFDVAAVDNIARQTGATVTSARRSPADNARAGGVTNSFHLTGQARDLVPPPGVSMANYAADLKQRLGPGYDVINENDHVHVEPSSRGGSTGGSRVVAQGAAKRDNGPEWVSETINGTPVLVNKTTGDRKADPTNPVEKPSKLGADAIARFSLMVPSAVTAVRTMKRLEDGGYSLNKDAAAARVAQTMGPGGIIGGTARALAGQDYQDYNQAAKAFESSILPILSGAAVSESEAERLVTAALPQIGDTKATAKTKAQSRQNMVKAAELLLRGASTKDIANLLIPADLIAGATPSAAKPAPRVGEIKNGYRYAGGDPAQRSSWVKQ